MIKKTITAACIQVLVLQQLGAWGIRGHTVANLAAVEAIPNNGPAFLKSFEGYIGHMGTIPDTWRSHTEPYLRISEDANHGWYTEGFSFIPDPPHSRTEFILRVYDEYLRVKGADPDRAKLLNIRYTGLQAYSIIEGYERVKAGMRLYRMVGNPPQGSVNLERAYTSVSSIFGDVGQIRQMLAQDVAFYMGWLGHYVADAAQPLHNSLHHDGWSGENIRNVNHHITLELVLHAKVVVHRSWAERWISQGIQRDYPMNSGKGQSVDGPNSALSQDYMWIRADEVGQVFVAVSLVISSAHAWLAALGAPHAATRSPERNISRA